jgi:hypothetical protein
LLTPYREFENQLTRVRRGWTLIKFSVWSQKIVGISEKLLFISKQVKKAYFVATFFFAVAQFYAAKIYEKSSTRARLTLNALFKG